MINKFLILLIGFAFVGYGNVFSQDLSKNNIDKVYYRTFTEHHKYYDETTKDVDYTEHAFIVILKSDSIVFFRTTSYEGHFISNSRNPKSVYKRIIRHYKKGRKKIAKESELKETPRRNQRNHYSFYVDIEFINSFIHAFPISKDSIYGERNYKEYECKLDIKGEEIIMIKLSGFEKGDFVYKLLDF
jgi:hypothetical protein